jgi:hypothetical protein
MVAVAALEVDEVVAVRPDGEVLGWRNLRIGGRRHPLVEP